MKLWEKLSATIFRLLAAPYLKTFEDSGPERVLKESLKVMDPGAIKELKDYVIKNQTPSGGFPDKAGKADLYYTLFGYFLAYALELNETYSPVKNYVEKEISQTTLSGVHLHCAAILSSRLSKDLHVRSLRTNVRNNISAELNKQPAYGAFLNLLTCYYLQDYKSLYRIRQQIKTFGRHASLPCPVMAALLVLERSFNRPVNELKKEVLSYYNGKGGFKATPLTPVPDLLSTAVALYALRFAGEDLRMIKPHCLEFVDSLYNEGGFGGNLIDHEPDIEYTFYGLLALGALAE